MMKKTADHVMKAFERKDKAGDKKAGVKEGSKRDNRLDAAQRKALPAATFGLPGKRAYPMPDASHAANAKARATQQVAAGNLTPAQRSTIDAKANRILKK